MPWLFVHFSDAVSLSQARRIAGFAPLDVRARRRARAARALRARAAARARSPASCCSASGPATSTTASGTAGPALATWIALLGGRGRGSSSGAFRRLELRERHGLGAAAAVCLALPVFVHGVWHWSPRVASDPGALSPRLVHRLRTVVPKGAVVIAPVQTSYRVTADAPVYVVALPVPHVANTKANDPYTRVRLVRHWV